MRKKAESGIGSLDLLLDTMCNTFGGVVFIAILLCVLTNAMGPSALRPEQTAQLPAPTREALQRQLEAEQLRNRVRSLQDILRREETLTAKAPAAPATPSPQTRAEMQAALKQAEVVLEQLTVQLQKTQQELQLARTSVQAAEKNLDASRARAAQAEFNASRPLRLPRLHEVKGKRSVLLAIKGKRFYAVQDVAVRFPEPRGYDSDEVTVVKKVFPGPAGAPQEVEVVEMKAEAGERVTEGAEKQGKLRLALLNLDAQKEFVVFGVAPDSFGEFNYLKRVFVDKGFEYQWQPLTGPMGVVPGAAVGQ